MIAYMISIGDVQNVEAFKDVYKKTPKGVVEELNKQAQEWQAKGKLKVKDGYFKVPRLNAPSCQKIDLTAKWVEGATKEDTATVIYGSKQRNLFWANINTIEIS